MSCIVTQQGILHYESIGRGQPIILLNDRQTIGGYPRLGALTPLACAQLAQCVPGTRVRLAAVTPGQARQDHLATLAAWQA